MTGQVVTAADLVHGWNCEGCGRPFVVGDMAYGEPHCMVGEVPSVEDFRCLDCQEAAA